MKESGKDKSLKNPSKLNQHTLQQLASSKAGSVGSSLTSAQLSKQRDARSQDGWLKLQYMRNLRDQYKN